jgi:hypothetical protein
MAAALITVAQAKAHLHRPDLADDDPDLLQKMAVAEAAILTYVQKEPYGQDKSTTWVDPATTPADAQHAILLRLAQLDRFRGDELANEGATLDAGSELTSDITSLLRRWASPVLG